MNFSQSRLIVSLLTVFIVLTSCQVIQKENGKPKVKNIILMIGDGMGPAYMKAYRLLKDNPATEVIEMTAFDHHLTGTIDTSPKGKVGTITDSAAAASAYATGQKVLSRTLSITENGDKLLTVLERAKQLGKSTGLIATSPLTGATPAAFIAHHPTRYEYSKIADQFIDNQINGEPNIDIILGGGLNYFVRNDRNLVEEFKSKGFNYVSSKSTLLKNTDRKMLGIFAPNELDKMMDRTKETPSLKEMTSVAIKQLSKNKNGFFLMIEGSQIDWAGHKQDIVGAMTEMEDFELALKEVINFAKTNNETQLILTADHSTGGLTIGTEVNGKKYYQWNSNIVNTFSKTPEEIIRMALLSGDLFAEFKASSTMELTQAEINALKQFNIAKNAVTEVSNTKSKPVKNISSKGDSKLVNQMMGVITKIINEHSYTGWTTKGHTGVDVNLYAFGPRTTELTGHFDNTEIGQFIFKLMNE